MRKFAIVLAAAGAAIGFAAPASAQYYPQPHYGYGYAQPAYAYGPRSYGYNAGIVQQLDMRIAGIRGHIRALNASGVIRWNKARSLDRQALSLQRSMRASAWNGVSPQEAYSLERRVARLEHQVRTAGLRHRYAPRYGARYAGYRW